MSDLRHKSEEFSSSGGIDKLVPEEKNSLMSLKIDAS